MKAVLDTKHEIGEIQVLNLDLPITEIDDSR